MVVNIPVHVLRRCGFNQSGVGGFIRAAKEEGIRLSSKHSPDQDGDLNVGVRVCACGIHVT